VALIRTVVMTGLVPAIHAVTLRFVLDGSAMRRRVDGRDKPGHDGNSFWSGANR